MHIFCLRVAHPFRFVLFFFFFNDPATTEIYTLSLHDALPISGAVTIRPSPGLGGGDVPSVPLAPRGRRVRGRTCRAWRRPWRGRRRPRAGSWSRPLGAKALVAAPGALVGGVVVVVGVRATHATTGAAPGAGPAGAGVRRRLVGAGTLALAAGLVLAPLPLVFLAAFAGALGGGAASAGAELALAAGVIGLGEGGAAVGALGVDAGHHRFVTSKAKRKATRARGPGGLRGMAVAAGQGWRSVARRLRAVARSHRL